MRCLFDSVLYHCAHPVKSDPRIIMYNNSRSTVSKSMKTNQPQAESCPDMGFVMMITKTI